MADATKGHTEEAARQSVLQCCIAPRAEQRELNRGKYVKRERGKRGVGRGVLPSGEHRKMQATKFA